MADSAFVQPIVRPLTQRAAPHRRIALLWAAFAFLSAAFLLSLALGPVSIPLKDILTVLLGGTPEKATWATIVVNFRLPKALTAVLAGAALAVGGLQMQTLFRNPLTDPFALGVSSGASLGVALVVLLAGTTGSVLLAGLGVFGDLGIAGAAIVGAIAVMVLVLSVARRVTNSVTLLIVGLMFGYAVGAVVSLLMYFSVAERIQTYINWTFGSFGGVTWRQMAIFAPAVIVGLGVALTLTKPLNALLLGETYARSMGIDLRRARVRIVTSTAILAGVVTAFCGPIGFLGLAVPHLARMAFRTTDHRTLIPACIALGGAVALIADVIAALPGSQIVLPLNAVTALIGAPVVIGIILRGRVVRGAFGS
jgi:iron complex transport system permease protein